MQGQTRQNGRPHPGLVHMLAGKPDDFVADACHHRHENNPAGNPFPQAGPTQEGENEDADQHDDHQEIGAAAGVQRRKGPHVFHLEHQSVFIGIDGLVFCPMVLEHPLDILLLGNGPDIGQENGQPQQPLAQVQDHGAGNPALKQLHGAGRHHHKQQNGQAHGHCNGAGHFQAAHFFVFLPGHLGRVG